MADVQDMQALVFDNGTRMTKAGFACDESPKAVFPTVVGRAKGGTSNRTAYVGDDTKFRNLKSSFPISRGAVSNWDDIEEIWRYTYKELEVDSDKHPVLLSEPPRNPKVNRERITQIMFESFDVPAMYVAIQAVLSLYSTGRATGIVLESGDGVSQAVPIVEGDFIPKAMSRLDIAGQDVTDYLANALAEQTGHLFDTPQDRETVDGIKEMLGYVAMDYEEEVAKSESSVEIQKSYELPDGEVITIAAERFACAEVLFQPGLVEMEVAGVHELVNNSIKKCKTNLQRFLYENIVLSGGSTMFNGFAERMRKEIVMMCPSTINVNVVAEPEREYAVWTGGCVAASLDSFKKSWILKEEYEESGPSIVFKKCF